MVEIDDDVAKRMAAHFRAHQHVEGFEYPRWADLLDPQPPTLREQVMFAWCHEHYGDGWKPLSYVQHDEMLECAEAVLAVVADWLAAQPTPYPDVVTRGQRDHDVRLLRGGSDD